MSIAGRPSKRHPTVRGTRKSTVMPRVVVQGESDNCHPLSTPFFTLWVRYCGQPVHETTESVERLFSCGSVSQCSEIFLDRVRIVGSLTPVSVAIPRPLSPDHRQTRHTAKRLPEIPGRVCSPPNRYHASRQALSQQVLLLQAAHPETEAQTAGRSLSQVTHHIGYARPYRGHCDTLDKVGWRCAAPGSSKP